MAVHSDRGVWGSGTEGLGPVTEAELILEGGQVSEPAEAWPLAATQPELGRCIGSVGNLNTGSSAAL